MKIGMSNKDKMIQMENVLVYLKEHIKENVRAEQVAAQFGYSAKYFEKLFRQYFEIPYPKYWTKIRMRYFASEILANECLIRAKDIEITGYGNTAAFSKTFKKELGVSPLNLLREHNSFPDMPIRKELFGKKITLEQSTEDLAVFSCERPKTQEETEEFKELLMRYVCNEWKVVNNKEQNPEKSIVEKMDEEKIYVYFPILKPVYTKKYSMEEWKDYIDEHISEDLTVVGLSKTFYRSKKYFRQCFKMCYGMEPRAYIVKKKAEMAKE